MSKMLYAKVDIPSDSTVSRDVREAHAISKGQVAEILQVLNFLFGFRSTGHFISEPSWAHSHRF